MILYNMGHMQIIHMNKINVFGNGFIGQEFCAQNKKSVVINKREDYYPQTNKILFFISTVDNYNVFSNPYIDIETNLLVLMEVLENCRAQFQDDFEFNFISSWFVYGDTDLPAKENSACNPKGFYSITKRAAEQMLISYCDTFKIPYRILRMANVLGPLDKKTSAKKNALQYMIQRMIKNEDLKLYYNGEFYRDYIDVRDAARAIGLVIEHGNLNEIYNIGNNKGLKFYDIFKYAYGKTESISNIDVIENMEFHNAVQVRSMYLDNSKLIGLRYAPKYSIYDTLDHIIEEYKEA